jgi:preprotein translocase subunit YajC
MDPSFLLIGAMLIVFYFLILRPQTKQAKQAKDFQAGIEKGARVVTSAGIHGKVIKVDETTVLIEVDNNVKLRVEKGHINLDLTKAAYGDGDKKPDAPAAKKADAEETK